MNGVLGMLELSLDTELNAGAARVPLDRVRLGRLAAHHHQRHPRLLQDRGRHAVARSGAVPAAANASRARSAPWRSGPTRRASSSPATSTRRCPTRWSATRAACGRSWSTWWATPSSSPPRARSWWTCASAPHGGGRGRRPLRRQRHRHRHRAGEAPADLRCLRPGGRLDHAAVRRHRPRPRHLRPAGRDDGRPDRGRERSRGGEAPSASPRGFALDDRSGIGSAGGSVELEGLRVLVVDDNATNRRILREMLGAWRMSAHTADSGRDRAHAPGERGPGGRAVSRW